MEPKNAFFLVLPTSLCTFPPPTSNPSICAVTARSVLLWAGSVREDTASVKVAAEAPGRHQLLTATGALQARRRRPRTRIRGPGAEDAAAHGSPALGAATSSRSQVTRAARRGLPRGQDPVVCCRSRSAWWRFFSTVASLLMATALWPMQLVMLSVADGPGVSPRACYCNSASSA